MPLILKRASLSRTSGSWSDDDYDVLSDGACVGRIFRAGAGVPAETPWFWGIEFHRRKERLAPYQGHSRDLTEAMQAFRNAWKQIACSDPAQHRKRPQIPDPPSRSDPSAVSSAK